VPAKVIVGTGFSTAGRGAPQEPGSHTLFPSLLDLAGKIEVHNPHKLETHVLNRYFRHSKFASFQRQLNYFGFRKLAGKGKMAPCSYVNDSTTNELGSLLLVKVRHLENRKRSIFLS
jgi:HSF-type DNA-binding